MTDITHLDTLRASGQSAVRHAQRLESRLSRFASGAVVASERPGFSARLNMLCGLAGERELGNGRLEDLVALNPEWDTDDVRAWLVDDHVPALAELRQLVNFLVAGLPSGASPEHWEAFLIYGAALINSPIRNSLGQMSSDLLPLASRTLAQISAHYRITSNSYDAEQKLQEIVALLRQLNIDERGESMQPGHRLMIASVLFPDRLGNLDPID